MTQVEIRNKKLIITLSLQEPKISKSGKTLVVASSHGNVITDVKLKGKPIAVVANAYVYREEEDGEE